MQHYVHFAKKLPGGDHLLRLARALGVSVEYLVTGQTGTGSPASHGPAHPGLAGGEPAGPTRIAIPLFQCGCPGACPLREPVPREAAAVSTVLLEAELVPMHATHRLIGLQVTPAQGPGWPVGARLIVDWDAREPQWEAVSLVQWAGRCHLGHLQRTGEASLFTPRRGERPHLLGAADTILGTAVAVVMRV
jgi:hypothetical protein